MRTPGMQRVIRVANISANDVFLDLGSGIQAASVNLGKIHYQPTIRISRGGLLTAGPMLLLLILLLRGLGVLLGTILVELRRSSYGFDHALMNLGL